MKRLLTLAAALSLVTLACKTERPATPEAAPAPKSATVTLLFTGAENGYLTPTQDGEVSRGGAAEVLGRWVRDEGHCPGPLGADGAASCPNASTVVASTGDNANGQAISSYFKGEPTMRVMRRMGYAASALGNHELDWSREQFLKNEEAGGFPYLAVNLIATSDEGKALHLQPVHLVERQGLKVALIGLSSKKATLTPMPGRMAGLTLVPDVDALEASASAARAKGAGLLVVLSDGCLDELAKVLAEKPALGLDVVVARKCEEAAPESVGKTKLVYPGRRLQQYAKVVVKADVARPAGQQVLDMQVRLVDVVGGKDAPPPDHETRALIAGYQQQLDAQLGAVVGHTVSGLGQEAPEMTYWLATALKEQFKADVGLVNRKGVRLGLKPGPITKASLYDIIPFENEIVTVALTGEQLVSALGNVEARVAGVRSKDDGFVDDKGAPVDPKKTYVVATPDYLYLGGDGFTLHKLAPTPTATKTSWQAATIAWLEAKKTTEQAPLEKLVQLKR